MPSDKQGGADGTPPIVFLASLPPIQSAIQLGGDGGGRLKLDFDEQQTDEVLRLAALRGQVFKVTVEREVATPPAGSKSQF